MARSIRFIALAISLVLALTVIGGCTRETSTNGNGDGPSVEPTPTPSEPTPTVVAKAYFIRGEKIGVAGRQVELAAGETTATPAFLERVVAALLEGPTAEEREFGLGTVIPEGTQVLGVETAGPVATVDLSSEYQSGGGSLSMLLRVAQVVCTLTQFEEFNQVAFKIDGTAVDAIGGEGIIVSPSVGREDFEGQLPAILVESPVPGQEVSSPLAISGSSNVFEATHQINVTDPEGLIIAEKTVTATSGTGTRGTWSEQVPFTTARSGLGAVIVFEYSAKDGSQINVVEIPVRMKP